MRTKRSLSLSSGSTAQRAAHQLPVMAATPEPPTQQARQPASNSRRRAALAMAASLAMAAPLAADAKTKWNDPNPNPGWDKYYGGKCNELERCVQAGDLRQLWRFHSRDLHRECIPRGDPFR